jgi:hypothetical protein
MNFGLMENSMNPILKSESPGLIIIKSKKGASVIKSASIKTQ